MDLWHLTETTHILTVVAEDAIKFFINQLFVTMIKYLRWTSMERWLGINFFLIWEVSACSLLLHCGDSCGNAETQEKGRDKPSCWDRSREKGDTGAGRPSKGLASSWEAHFIQLATHQWVNPSTELVCSWSHHPWVASPAGHRAFNNCTVRAHMVYKP